jgi:hypothetical protein
MTWRKDMDETRRRELERERIKRMHRRMEQRDLPAQERPRLDTRAPAPLSADEVDARIAEMIRENYDEFLSPLLARVIAHEQDTGASNLEAAFQKLRTEISKLESEIAQLRALFFNEQAAKAEKSAPASVDPSLLRHRTQVN